MNLQLAKELKAAGFPIRYFEVGHQFYPNENNAEFSEASGGSSITITPYELQHHARDIEEGYYCPNLPDLIEACGEHFAHLYVEADIWTAESDKPPARAVARSAEEAVAELWLSFAKMPPQNQNS
jgi:hypothetical protein